MNNNSNDINLLLQELAHQKNKDRKYLLKIEIAKATDRSVKLALQEILDDIERQEKTSRIIGSIVVIIIIGVILYVLGTREFNATNNHIVPMVSSSSSLVISSSLENTKNKLNETTESRKKEISLTNHQVKEWVSAVWDKRHQNYPDIKDYRMNIRSDDKDKLVYIDLLPPKDKEVDKYSVFRINAKGELEESGYYNPNGGFNNWVVVSRQFMDTSEVEIKPEIIMENKKETQNITNDITRDEAIQWVQDYLKSQAIEPLDFTEVEFKTQIGDEGFLEVMLYSWNPARTAKTFSSLYRINADGKLEQGSAYVKDDWHVVSEEFIK